jgi:hypothetical protein
MILSKKFKLVSCHNIAGRIDETSVMNKDLGLYASKEMKGLRGWIGEGVSEKLIKPKLYVCTNCGYTEINLDNSQLDIFREIENDETVNDAQ